MKNFKKDGFRKGGNDFGGRPNYGGERKSGGGFGGGRDRSGRDGREGRGGDRQSETKELFPATCTSCHKACEVPFRPSGDKPVYCRECFVNKDKGGNRDSREGNRSSGDFKRGSHTVHRDVQKGGGNEDVKKQLAVLESKVNRILELLSTKVKTETVVVSTKPDIEAPKKTPPKETKKNVETKEEKAPAKKKVAKKVPKKTAKKVAKKTKK